MRQVRRGESAAKSLKLFSSPASCLIKMFFFSFSYVLIHLLPDEKKVSAYSVAYISGLSSRFGTVGSCKRFVVIIIIIIVPVELLYHFLLSKLHLLTTFRVISCSALCSALRFPVEQHKNRLK